MDIKNSEVHQYLTFILEDETFGFNVLKIREVLDLTDITKIPKTPEYMSGIINLRGSVVPVIDLRALFDLNKREFTIDTSIIIIEVIYDQENILIGVLVDAVKAVIKLESKDMSQPPKIGMKLNSNYIESIGKINNDFVMILNTDKIFSEEELDIVKKTISSES